MQGNRIMVVGQDVVTVQRVSRYCLERGADVFPYYGIPSRDEVALFDPEISILCLPLPEQFLCQVDHPYILWSEQLASLDLPLVSTRKELECSLQEALCN